MTTDITELALREKFEAWWERTQHNGNPPRFGWECWRDGEGYKVDDDDSELDGMWEAWKAAGAELVEALEKAQQRIAQVVAERDALREGEIGNAKHSNTRAAADIYFQLAEECDIPAGGSLVEFVDGLKERVCDLESRTVTVKPMRPGHITVGGEKLGIYMRDEVDEFLAALTAAGIKWEAE